MNTVTYRRGRAKAITCKLIFPLLLLLAGKAHTDEP